MIVLKWVKLVNQKSKKMYKLEDKMDRVGKRIKKKESPASLMGPTKPKMGMKKKKCVNYLEKKVE